MNKQIFDFLNEYAKLPSPQYAVLLRGTNVRGTGQWHQLKLRV